MVFRANYRPKRFAKWLLVILGTCIFLHIVRTPVRHVELDQAARSELDADAAAFRAQATLRTRYRTVDTHRPIPVMPLVVMASHRPEYLGRVLKSIHDASKNSNHRRPCVFVLDLQTKNPANPGGIGNAAEKGSRGIHYDAQQEVIKLINSNDTHRICDVRIARHRMPARLELEELAVHASHSGLSARAAHLKWHWLWTQRQVWETELSGYDGDILFLEDDLRIAPDAFHALEFMSHAKHQGTRWRAQVMTLGAWGGENLAPANSRDFKLKTMNSFPTMGYAFNRTMWNTILTVVPSYFHSKEADWSIALGEALAHVPSLGMHNVMVYQPTLSRVWHIGSKSAVGNHHNRNVKGVPNWSGFESQLLQNASSARLVAGLANTFGLPCRDEPNSTNLFAHDVMRQLLRSSGAVSEKWGYLSLLVYETMWREKPSSKCVKNELPLRFKYRQDGRTCELLADKLGAMFFPLSARHEVLSADDLLADALNRRVKWLCRCQLFDRKMAYVWPSTKCVPSECAGYVKGEPCSQ